MSPKPPKSDDTKAKIFEAFIADKKILIADTSATARASLANTLVNLGAKMTSITLASTYLMAEEEIERVKPKIVICDYNLGKRCGLDLLQKQREHHPETKDLLFILVTGNSSQSAVAKAAEEDVDMFLLKPFTAEVLRSSILKAALGKIDPSDYIRTIRKGSEELEAGKYEEAIKSFEYATTLDPSPSLACAYLGQAQLVRNLLEPAQGSYQKGLSYNKIHYRCMVGLYEVFMTRKRYEEAYDIIRKISHYFPANPQRLTSVLRLAILTKSYEDVERYYQTFTNIDERNEEMVRYVCAALVVCGRYYLQKNLGSRAMELFQKAAATASGRTRILREIVLALVEFNLAKQADEFLKRFPPETQTGADYLAMNLLIMEKLDSRALVIEKGREALAKDIHDPVIYQVLIRASRAAGLANAADDLVRTAVKKWPDQKDSFSRPAAATQDDSGAQGGAASIR